ncbi:MAG: MFS transporter [Micropruina sp.]|nr:MFS transporter [Micropruina sp.]
MSTPDTRDADAPAGYRRTRLTWVAFGALFAFGVLNATLGPVLPYLRAAQGTSHVEGAFHQVAYALGGLTAGLQASRSTGRRKPLIVTGLAVAAAAGLLLAYGLVPAATVAAAFLIGGFATAALIRTWAVVADAHLRHRAVAMSEGEVLVSLAGIATPLLISACAASLLGWQFSFVIAAAVVAAALLALWPMPLPAPMQRRHEPGRRPDEPGVLSTRRTFAAIIALVALEWALTFWAASYLFESVGLPQDLAVALVSVLFAATLAGRALASRLARRMPTLTVLQLSLATALAGCPILLLAQDALVASAGLAVAGMGIGATFPLASALHVGASRRTADQSMGQILAVAGVGQIVGPVIAGALAQYFGLRVGLLVVPALLVLAAIIVRPRRARPTRAPDTTYAKDPQ